MHQQVVVINNGKLNDYDPFAYTPDGTLVCYDFFQTTSTLSIITPVHRSDVNLTQSKFTATPQIPFEANPSQSDATVQWTTQLQYQTSGSKGNYMQSDAFTTLGAESAPMSYASVGGC